MTQIKFTMDSNETIKELLLKTGTCPNCEEKVNVGPVPKIGTEATCRCCHHRFVVVWLNPIELDTLEEEYYSHQFDFNEPM